MGSPVHVIEAEVTLVELEFRHPVGTAIGSHRRRPVVMVQLIAEGSTGRGVGWGECAALADTTFDREDAASAFNALTQDLLPRLAEGALPGGVVLPGPSDLAQRVQPDGMPLAFAALEMAVADVHLRSSGTSFGELLGVTDGATHGASDASPPSVLVGAVVGVTGSVETLLAQVDQQVEAGFARVKLKIGPGWDIVPVAAVRRRHPDLILQVDANGSYSRADTAHLVELDRLDLACIEQPLPRHDLDGHVALARAMRTPVCLDESLDSPAAVRTAIAMGACEVVCLKPARLGGLTAALEVHRDCTEAGVPLWLGGMFESGYARAVNTALAALPGFDLPGDLAPSATYLAEDLVPPPYRDRHGPDGHLRVALDLTPGLGPDPDQAIVARRAAASWRWPAR